MKTMEELRNQLLDTAEGLEGGTIDLKVAAELNNTAGKIINTVRTQLEYAQLQESLKTKLNIKFLKCN